MLSSSTLFINLLVFSHAFIPRNPMPIFPWHFNNVLQMLGI
ncbi:hypothetical protein KP509_1Z151500 [Ceratopteris richardii]|nr:hypothetical protein KP509_1Z151500 [Ceratopteris richardii]